MVGKGSGKQGQGFPQYFLMGIEISAKGMVNKYRIIFNTGYPAMRISIIGLAKLAQAITGKIISGPGDQIASANGAGYAINNMACPQRTSTRVLREWPGFSVFMPAGKAKKQEEAI